MRRRATPGQLEFWNDNSASAAQDLLFPIGQLDLLEPGRRFYDHSSETGSTKNSKLLEKTFAQKRPLKILVADDNEINRKVIRVILQKLGYSCEEAENGEQALKLHSDGKYDFIFMDLDMPEMDGLESTTAIRNFEESSDSKAAEIIAVTANVSAKTRLRCRRVGMNGYLEKPITASVIKDQLIRSWPRVRSRCQA